MRLTTPDLDASPEQAQSSAPAPFAPRCCEPRPSSWINVVSHLDPKYGGLSTVVPELCTAVAATGAATVSLAAFCAPGDAHVPANAADLPITCWPTSRAAWFRGRNLRDQFRDQIGAADGVHIHGLWEQSTAIAARTARELHKPYVLSAHGMLEPWALANKGLKKRLYAALVERANVRGAACLHALTHAEALNYRAFGSRAPIAVIPNGVHIPDSLSPDLFLSRFPALRGKKIVLFLGRIHFKKGLDLLVQSWATLARQHPDAHLVLAGPDSEGTQATIEALIAQHQIASQVTFTGMLDHAMKWSAFAAAECFVLPSYSEGLSTAVLEAMGAGLPVIVTTQCNFPEVKAYETGWEIQSTVDDLTYSLQDFLSRSTAANRATGERGTRLVADRFDWPSVARRMGEVYLWLAGGPSPQSVELLMAQP